jgi:hypothetical protein
LPIARLTAVFPEKFSIELMYKAFMSGFPLHCKLKNMVGTSPTTSSCQ